MTPASGSDRRTLTLLHLSDPQFGRHHREATGATAADRDHDTLRARLLQDLAGLRDGDEPVHPDLVVVTGDLSEWARPSELTEFERFARELLQGLELPPERLVLVPGNHDVSWKACEAYFAQCEAEEREPQAPFWPKWRFYTQLFDRLYGEPQTPFEFNEARPWSLFVYEPLKTVVAGLNSTMPETHREGDHYGELGEDQLRWFAEQLRPFRDQGWLRIAALHHNVQRKAVDDDENLRDAERLQRLVGDLVNVVLHGHTHDGKLGWLGSAVPILSTGSAAVREQARPHGVPCQYQLVQVHPEGLRRWTRAYQPAQNRWVGDTAASDDGNDWRHDHPVHWEGVHGIFAPPPDEDEDVPEPLRFAPRRAGPPADDFLAQLAEICRLRDPQVQVVRHRKGPPLYEYLELRHQRGDQVQLVPLGACERGLDRARVDAFVQRVVQPYRQRDGGVQPVLVYGGPPAPPELLDHARAAGVWLRSYEQHCGLIDFRRYQARLAQRLAQDRVYPSDKYVGQRLVEHFGRQRVHHDDALAAVEGWLRDEHGRFVLVLGSFGTGKTFLLRQLARRLAERDGTAIPILVEMRSLEKGLRLEQLLAQHFALHEVDDYSPARFMRMLKDGRVVLLFDGFDELVVRSTYARAAEHFDTIVAAARGRAKVVVTSRRQHFLSDHQAREAVRQGLMQKVEGVPGHRVVTLLPFARDQIERFLAWHLDDPHKARERMRLIDEVRDLTGLSENPRMLGFIAALSEEELRAARDQRGAVSAAGLYRSLLDRWLAFEQDRRHPRGAAPGLTIEARWAAITELAVRLWTRGEHQAGSEELADIGAVLVELARGSKEEAGFQIGSGTLLVRDEDGRFSFIHESVLEWLVARAAAQALKDDEAPALLGRGKMSQLLADFLIDLAGAPACQTWSARGLARNLGNATADNALMLRQRLVAAKLVEEPEEAGGVDLTQQDLRGRDLSGQVLQGATLTGADLRRANLRGTVLRDAKLDRATLRHADLGGADLRQADLRHANLEHANLVGARLEGARLSRANLERAKLLGTTPDLENATEVRHWGAALPNAPLRPVVATPLSSARALALSPADGLLAVGDGHWVRLWDLAQGRELYRWVPRGGIVTALTFDDQRALLVGTATGVISKWTLDAVHWSERVHQGAVTGLLHTETTTLLSHGTDGQLLRPGPTPTLVHHADAPIDAVAVHPGTRRTAVGSRDGSLRLLGRGTPLQPHPGGVTALAWSPNGTHLVSGGNDGMVVLYRVYEHNHKARLKFKATIPLGKPIVAVCFVGGSLIASASWDGQVRLWQFTDNTAHTFDRHPGMLTAMAFDPESRRLVSASLEGGVRTLVLPSPTAGDATLAEATSPATRLGPAPRPGIRALAPVVDGSLTVLVDDRILTATATARLTRSVLDVTGADHVLPSRDGLGVVAVRGAKVTVHRFLPFEGTKSVQLEHQLQEPPTRVGITGKGSSRVLLATSGPRSHIQLLHLLEGERDMLEHQGTVGPAPTALRGSPDGRWIAVACADHSIHVFSPMSQQFPAPPQILAGHHHSITALDVCDERMALTGSIDGETRLWDLLAGTHRQVWTHAGGVTAVAFGPEGHVVVGGADGTVQLHHVDDRRTIVGRVGHQGAVTSIAFSGPTLLATGSRDGTVQLWRLPTLTVLATLAPLPEGWVSFAPDGRYKAGGRTSGHFWHSAMLCRFEEGELDDTIEGLRLRPDGMLLDPERS